MNFIIIIYILLGILPSILWLFYYLKKDLHPEPKKMIIQIFFWGVFTALPVLFVQLGLTKLLDIVDKNIIHLSQLIFDVIYWFIVIAFSEEFFKFLIVRTKIVSSPHLDEPLDIMLYMTVAALGFAAIENVLYLIPTLGQMPFETTLLITLIRSLGAVFLHTLCSAVIGYSMAISFCEAKRKYIYLIVGILIATVLHGLFNFSIITLHGNIRFIIPTIIILTLAFLTFVGFEKLKKMKGICKI